MVTGRLARILSMLAFVPATIVPATIAGGTAGEGGMSMPVCTGNGRAYISWRESAPGDAPRDKYPSACHMLAAIDRRLVSRSERGPRLHA